MYNSNVPAAEARELPSSRQLLKSTLIAAAVAAVLLVTVVMPAEYGIDPTRIGGVLGLQRMGEIKVSLAEEAAADAAADAAASPAPVAAASAPSLEAERSDVTTVTLAPDEGTEIKLSMAAGGKVRYGWTTDGGEATFDAHGDSQALGIDYRSYEKGREASKEGELEAPFDGSHGWFWRNRTATPMTITLQTDGQYAGIKRF